MASKEITPYFLDLWVYYFRGTGIFFFLVLSYFIPLVLSCVVIVLPVLTDENTQVQET